MQEIIIDEEFRFLLPTLDNETYARLEEDLLQNGCRDALVLWRGILIDGYNRFAICTKHDIPYSTVDMEFDSREDVLIWIIKNQISRRNLTPIQLSHFRGVHFRSERKKTTNENGHNQFSEVVPQNEGQPKSRSTAVRLANQYNVSRATIERDSRTAEAIDAIGEISPEAKRMILAGEMKLDRKTLKSFSSMPIEELSDVATEIEDGTFKKQENKTPPTNEKQEPEVSIASVPKSLDDFKNMMTSNFYDWHKFLNSSARAEAKAALRNHIDMLEELYSQM